MALGAGLGLVVARMRGEGPPSLGTIALGITLGAAGGAALGVLPGPLMELLRRGWSVSRFLLFDWLARRRLSRIHAACEQALTERPNDEEARLRLAAKLWLEGAGERAQQMLLSAAESPDPSALLRHNLAVAEASSGRHSRAVSELEQAATQMKGSATLRYNLGLARWAMGQFQQAAEALEEAVELDPRSFSARNALALVLARQGELDRATEQLEQALALSRRHPGVLCNLGIIHQARGDLEVAHHYFSGALDRDPDHVVARFNRGLSAMLQGRHHAAFEDLTTLTRSHRDHGRGLMLRAICCYRLGRTGRALEAARRASHRAPNDFQVRYNTGTLLLRESLIEQALPELEQAYALNPKELDVIVNLGVAAYLSGRLRQALDHFRAAVRVSPRHALARYNCAVAYNMLDMVDEADRHVAELLQLYPDFPEAYNAVGVLRLFQERLVEATEQFRRAADAMPTSAVVRSNLALTYYLQGDTAAAEEQVRYALALDSDLPAARDIAGHAALALDKNADAVEHLTALARMEPSNPDIHANLGLAYYRDDRLNEAIDCYKRVLIFSPNSPEGHNDLGLAYAKSRMLEEAARHLGRVIEWRPENPVAHSNLGLVYYFKGDTEKAVDQWRDVTRLSPTYARRRQATRFSTYDDQEIVPRTIERSKRVTHFPLKVAAFRHSFQLAFDENDYHMELPWPDLRTARQWLERGLPPGVRPGSS